MKINSFLLILAVVGVTSATPGQANYFGWSDGGKNIQKHEEDRSVYDERSRDMDRQISALSYRLSRETLRENDRKKLDNDLKSLYARKYLLQKSKDHDSGKHKGHCKHEDKRKDKHNDKWHHGHGHDDDHCYPHPSRS